MVKIASTLFPLCLVYFVKAQQLDKDSNYFKSIPCDYIKLTANANDKPSLPFTDVIIRDARADTSITGFDLAYDLTFEVNRICFRSSFSAEVPRFIKTQYNMAGDSSQAPKLVIIVKKFWLSNAIQIEDNETQDDAVWGAGVIIKADCLVEQNGVYHTLYQVDSVLASDNNLNIHNYRVFIQEGIKAILAKAADVPFSALKTGHKNFSGADIEDYISTLNTKSPALASPKRGIYVSYAEFLNNTPSITDFDYKSDDKVDIMYVKDATGNYVLREYWGYCDGQKFYIHSSGNNFELCAQGSTFNCLGFKSLTKRKSIKVGNVLAFGLLGGALGKQNKSVSYHGKIRPFQLDMETGELY